MEFLFLGSSIKCYPVDYDITGKNQENAIPSGRFPILNWTRNNYADWLRLNALNMNVGVAFGGVDIVSGLTQMGFAETGGQLSSGGDKVLGGIKQITNIMLTNYQHSLIPNSAVGNVNNADINTASQKNGFFFIHKSIKKEYAKKIDDYFSMYGYKVNALKTPNIKGRTNWNFVKMADCNIEGTEIPEEDLNKYKRQLLDGITFWHNYSTFRDYSQTNNIVI